ncbi:MAG TPA: HAMP domain-containing sensor histidine kinase [Candidatus Saccharimonadales bacterium]|nr:HAMP domain-containing sensor histidine kinase [Candidatus Saccharimonadales bacterium]
MTLNNKNGVEKATEGLDNKNSNYHLTNKEKKTDSNSNSFNQTSGCYDRNLNSIRNDKDDNPPKALEEKTVVVYGVDKTTELILRTLNNTKDRWDNYADSQGPTIAMGVEQLRKGMRQAYERGVKIKYLSEITNRNINYCKELMKIAEVRHVDNAKGGMAVSEGEYIATAKLHEAKPVSHLIYSNVMELVEQQQHVFKSLWINAIPATQRIREIENGHKRIETMVLDDLDEISNKIGSLSNESDEILICSDTALLKIVHDCYFSVYQEIMEKYDKGNHKGVRWITGLSCEEDVNVAKLFMDLGIKIRSIRNLPPLNFLVTDNVFFSNAGKIDHDRNRKIIKQLFTTNDVLYINQYKTIFEELWRNGIDAADIIEDIKRGLDNERVDIIQRSNNAETEYLDLLKSANREIMLILPTVNALQRQWKLGMFELITQAAINRNVNTRILIPSNKKTESFIKSLQKQSLSIRIPNGNSNNNLKNIDIRSFETLAETGSTILIVDKKVSLVMELKDDSKEEFHEAIGISTYSNSKAGVLSYVSIFENLWNQTELYQQLKKSEDLQNDFIRIAAHELRNPIQPILLISEILKSTVNSKEWDTSPQLQKTRQEINEYIDSIIRNTKKVVSLSNSILDITRIETNTLVLRKEVVDLRLFLLEQMMEYETQHAGKIENQNLHTITKIDKCIPRLDYSQLKDDLVCSSVATDLDKSRISQAICNLLDNAFKFTNNRDTIHITLSKEYSNGQKYAVVSIRDSGKGIDRDILPRLFTKFATKSEKGIGLGLFITKSIIEAHGGRIWASNNINASGATFSFTLPCYP